MIVDVVCLNGSLRYECWNLSFVMTSAMQSMYVLVFANGNKHIELGYILAVLDKY